MSNWKLTIGIQKGEHFVNLYYEKRRIRFWNGKAIGLKLSSKDNPELLKAAIELKLLDGWRPKTKSIEQEVLNPTVIEVLIKGIAFKKSQGCSDRYIKDINRVLILWKRFEKENSITNLKIDSLTSKHLSKFLIRPNWSPKTQRTVKSTLSPLLSMPQLTNAVKLHKPVSVMHKPIDNIAEVLKEVSMFNDNLHLCCLMTYGCLLRPHKELRELTWGDFTADLSYIKLSGSRNKSGRNRIVPVPSYVRELLNKEDNNLNIFTGTTNAPNPDYFKTIWGRFKKVSKLLEQDQTLYSFRHSGAIEIYKRTGSLSKLQKALGHSSLAVSLTYLRGLEVSELEEKDMPMV
ncbi:integrase family protein [Flavobacteria bacterium MS024-3C]|nr:integrase family protein [Flavobacteria bacterium MS024-3C]